jgi:hypothetical protein
MTAVQSSDEMMYEEGQNNDDDDEDNNDVDVEVKEVKVGRQKERRGRR